MTDGAAVVERALVLLADGQWHDARPILAELQKLVTPGVAVRRAESRRRAASPGAPAARVIERPLEQLIAQGQRQIVMHVISRMIKDGRLETTAPLPRHAYSGAVEWKIRRAR